MEPQASSTRRPQPASRALASRPHKGREGGFTLVELVVVIGLLGVVAAVAAPRLFSMGEIEERFFADEVRSALSHGQKRAVSTGCEVQVSIDATGYTLRQRVNCAGAFTQDVPHPAGTATSYSGAPPSGVPLTSTVNPIVFDALGRARDGGGNIVDVSVGVGSVLITTVGETGLVLGPGA